MAKNLTARLGAYALIVRMYFVGLLVLSISRMALIIWQSQRVLATHELFEIFIQGVRADIILMSMGAAVPVLLVPILAYQPLAKTWFRITYLWALIWLGAVVFMELATPPFIAQYDIRPNRLFFEYLKYPKEVWATLWYGFRASLIFGFIALGILIFAFHELLSYKKEQLQIATFWKTWLAWPIAVTLLFIGIRSTTQHRPANPSLFAITSDAMVNSLVINSGYSLLYALYNLQYEEHSSEIYGKQGTATMLAYAKDWPWLKDYSFNNTTYPTLHQQTAAINRDKPLNIVIVLEESLGATFVKSLGGRAVTPKLDKLKDQGIWFDRMYSTGTRSVRGIEAVVAGYFPTPAKSTVKLSLSQRHFSTLPSVLKQHGYSTEFIYGGEAHFDNMRGFFTGNGVDKIVDISEIEQEDQNGVFIGSWGASDEDLFEQAHQELSHLHASGQPFFSLIFTSSNHSPFQFPDGRIEPYEKPKNTVNNAVQYADWALGRFIQQAKQSKYWQDTIFLIVADHDTRVYGDQIIPIDKFHIPAVILGANIKPQRIAHIASQVDLAPTLLSLAGVSSEHPFMGRDFIKYPDAPGRALLQFYNIFALLEEDQLEKDKVTILRPSLAPIIADYNLEKRRIGARASAIDNKQIQKALAQSLLPAYLYRNRLYQPP